MPNKGLKMPGPDDATQMSVATQHKKKWQDLYAREEKWYRLDIMKGCVGLKYSILVNSATELCYVWK